MTVEQAAQPRYDQNKPAEEHIYSQVKEITGIEDEKLIREAINACWNTDGKYDMSHILNMLITDQTLNKKENNTKMAITCSKDKNDIADAVAGAQQNQNKNKGGVIDLTNVSDSSESEDIQKAIAASLADSSGPYVLHESSGILGGQVTREEQDISRVLEQSLIENKAGTKRKRGDIWFVDPLNPHERKRIDGWPIGLKNVGNTCWFSAVIQSLFHLRRFRHLVLNYQPNKDLSQGNSEERRNLRFMQELRQLFALMVGSKRKYVDPSKAVDILKEAFATSIVSSSAVHDSQQDVSEFQHKLLDWLEDAFKSIAQPCTPPTHCVESSTSCDKISGNPMVDLFYGQYRAEGVNEGKGFINEETFGQFPLQVNGFHDIHESLEAATASREIETLNSQTNQKSRQELWFTRLPPVLTFELSRFQFNQQLGRPEKIHNKIEFPQVIFMDRYMDANRNETRNRRESAKKLKEELIILQGKLDKFINYGSGVKRFPLQDVLLYALEFAKTRPDISQQHFNINHDVDMECLSPNTSNNMGSDSPIKSPQDVAMRTVTSPNVQLSSSYTGTSSPSVTSCSQLVPDITMSSAAEGESSSIPHDVAMATEFSSSSMGTREAEDNGSPHPRHVTDGELLVLQDCLHRWRTEVENDVRELQVNIGRLEESVSRMYNDESMTKHPYHLHAVLVHEGQAASGHYWAYIYDSARSQWLKFNDITVCEASWEELEKECVGGYHNASAYCLMYIDKSKVTELSDYSPTTSGNSITENIGNLPDDLKRLVNEDSQLFAEEIQKWDEDLAAKATGSCDKQIVNLDLKTPTPNLLTPSTNSTTVSTQTIQPTKSLTDNVSQLSCQDSFLSLMTVLQETDIYDQKGADEALNMAVQRELSRLKVIAQKLPMTFPVKDPRLKHIVLYALHCDVEEDIINVLLLEQFAEIHPDANVLLNKIKACSSCAASAVKEFMSRFAANLEQKDNPCKKWHEHYQSFLTANLLLINGIAVFLEEKFEKALCFLVHAHLLSETLRRTHTNAGFCEPKIGAFFLRRTLLHISESISQQFEDHTNGSVAVLFHSMCTLVLPCLQTLLQTGYQEDITAVEEIREKWCSFLGQEIKGEKSNQLQEFLVKLFDPPLDMPLPRQPTLSSDMINLYKQYCSVIEIAGENDYIELAQKVS